LKRQMEVPKMSQNKTLVAYETKGGATEESARKIVEVLRSKYQLEVDLINLKKQDVKDCSLYRNIVVGGGVRGGKVYGKALKCLENDFSCKKVAFFVCSGDAGDPAKHEQAKVKFVENVLANYPNVKPVATEAFGGRMKVLGRTVFDNVDLAKVEAWAEELGKKFSSSRE
jgi:menaquinone-dependent protoporphyrinogen IX oxidase